MHVDRTTRESLIKKYDDEKVFIVPFEVLDHIPDRFTKLNLKANNDLAIKRLVKYDTMGRYVYRYDAEHNPVFQQLIPYIIITNRTEEKFFVAERIAGEQRLLKSLSLGFGGHINPCDGSSNVIMNAMRRELQEEVKLNRCDNHVQFVGHVRDLSSPLPDHLGFVFVVKATKASIKENDSLVGQWMDLAQLENNYFSFEGWAKHIIDYLHIYKKFL